MLLVIYKNEAFDDYLIQRIRERLSRNGVGYQVVQPYSVDLRTCVTAACRALGAKNEPGTAGHARQPVGQTCIWLALDEHEMQRKRSLYANSRHGLGAQAGDV